MTHRLLTPNTQNGTQTRLGISIGVGVNIVAVSVCRDQCTEEAHRELQSTLR